MGFKNDVSYEKRHQEASRIRSKYPELIPVICEKTGSSDIPTIDRRKYLVPPDLTMGQFISLIFLCFGFYIFSKKKNDNK